MKESLSEVFDTNKDIKSERSLQDYEIFEDKILLDEIRELLIKKLIDAEIKNKDELKSFISDSMEKDLKGYDLSDLEKDYVYNLIENEVYGIGPITELLDDPFVTEIMVNGPREVYIESNGKVSLDNTISFINDKHILRTIERIVGPLGRTIDTKNPMVDARLEDGSRVNAIIPPLSLSGPVLTIRKFQRKIENLEELIGNGMLTPFMARFLEGSVVSKLNIIISGGAGAGKTTVLNALTDYVGEDRVITIEDAAELNLKNSHVVSLETRNENVEGEGLVSVRDLVRNALRMRPDRIIIGEIRGAEAFDMLEAMNTGHDGSITTLHANDTKDALDRLESMVLMAGLNLPLDAVRGYIYNAIDLVVHVERLRDGKRRITKISEVSSMKDGNIVLKDIFEFKKKKVLEDGVQDGSFSLLKGDFKAYKKIKEIELLDLKDIFEEGE